MRRAKICCQCAASASNVQHGVPHYVLCLSAYKFKCVGVYTLNVKKTCKATNDNGMWAYSGEGEYAFPVDGAYSRKKL